MLVTSVNLGSHLKFIQYRGLVGTILTPLQARTVLFRADQRRAAQRPPLPPQLPEKQFQMET